MGTLTAERTSIAKRRRSAKSFFANSPLTFLDVGDSARTIEQIRKGLPVSSIDYVAGLLSLSRSA